MRASTATLQINDSAVRSPAMPLLAIVAAVTSWGLGSVLVKLTSIDGLAISFYRVAIGATVMYAVLRLTGRRLTWPTMRRVAPAGLIFGVNIVFYFTGLKLTSVANATLISALQPAIVLLFAGPWFGEKVGAREMVWTAISIGGIAVVILGSTGAPEWSPLGDALATISVLTFTVYFMLSKRAREDVGALEYTTAVQLSAALIVLPVGAAHWREVASAGGMDFVWLPMFVVIGGLGGHLLLNWAHAFVDVSVSSLLVLLTPVVAAAGAWMVLGESLGPLQITGGLVTLAAILVVVRGQESRPAPAPLAAPEALAPER